MPESPSWKCCTLLRSPTFACLVFDTDACWMRMTLYDDRVTRNIRAPTSGLFFSRNAVPAYVPIPNGQPPPCAHYAGRMFAGVAGSMP